MAVNINVERTGTENSLSTLRRFNKMLQGSGIVKRVRSLRYKERNKSHLTRKKRTLTRIARRKEVEQLIKSGKMPDKMVRK